MISQDSIEGLKTRLDIVDVVGNYIELKRAGSNFKAVCPFHDEKSPSFNVSPSKQIYHCFGCGAGGDAIKFVMEYEKLNYPEAIERLADQYNYTLHYTANKPQQKRSQLMEKLNEYYQNTLTHHNQALAYLKERGIFESSVERFGIGYAPASQQTLTFIKSNLFTMQEAIELGVAGHESGRSFARFIERITFPIHAPNGSIVGFGGRTISGHVAKYVNSPQTKLFNKSKLLYAYHLAKETIYRKKEMIVTEGYLDVVMLHQAGFTQAVATLGTALTAEHLPLLRKGEPNIIMAYDGDNAGRNAATKASMLLSASGFNGGVILFGNGMDPADMVNAGQVEELNNLFRQPQPFIEFVLDQIIAKYNIKDPKAKEQALNEVIGYLKTLSPLLQEEYKPYVASRLGISSSLIRLSRQSGNAPAAPIRNAVSHRDMWETSLIKTVIESPQVIDQILDFIDPSLLQYHGHEFELALQGRIDDPALMAITVDESVLPFANDEEVRKELITFLTQHYNRELRKVNSRSDLSFEKKAFLIRNFRGKIAKLQRGELVPFEG
jgi:DNA primase